MANDDIRQITTAVEEAVTYPILTRDAGGYRSGGRNGESSESSGGGSLTRTAQGAIRDILGWRYRVDDPKGFLAALTKAVDLKEVEGRTEWKWKARPFMVQADLGEVTGAQASIYTRAKVALDHALPLLDGLVPIRSDANEEQLASIRSIIRSAWGELVNELGRVSGPRIQRVDDYFYQLLELPTPQPSNGQHYDIQIVLQNPGEVKGSLGKLAKRFGFQRDTVLTVDQEQNYTNFLILVDYTASLFQTWNAQKQFLMRNGSADKFLGTQLVRLSEELAVIAEAVQESYAAMDSVFFGPEERQVAVLTFAGKLCDVEPITVAELLSWIEHFVTVEAPQLIEDSGRDGVAAVSETLAHLRNMLNAIVDEV